MIGSMDESCFDHSDIDDDACAAAGSPAPGMAGVPHGVNEDEDEDRGGGGIVAAVRDGASQGKKRRSPGPGDVFVT